jgi:hypothetical protein
VEIGDMQSSTYNDALDEYFQLFNVATRQEPIQLRRYLATEHVAALAADDITYAAVIEALFDRTESLLERIGRHEVGTAIRVA